MRSYPFHPALPLLCRVPVFANEWDVSDGLARVFRTGCPVTALVAATAASGECLRRCAPVSTRTDLDGFPLER